MRRFTVGERALALYHALGEVEGEGRAVWLIGLMHGEFNRPEPALIRLVLIHLAWAYLELGEEHRAEALLAESHTRAVAHRHRYFLVDALRVQAMLRMRQAQWKEAVTALEETLALCRAMPYPYAEAKALSVYGQLHVTKGELERAREKYVAAIAICERLGEGLFRPHIERALTDLDRR